MSGLLKMGELRAMAAAALAPSTDLDPDVHPSAVDAIDPPCVMLVWDDPWLEPQTPRGMTNGSGYWSAQFTVRCIAGRIDVPSGIETLEGMASFVLGRLMADTYTWPAATVSAPRVLQIGNLDYLFADVQYRVPVTVSPVELLPPPGPAGFPFLFSDALVGSAVPGTAAYDSADYHTVTRMFVADQTTESEDIRTQLMTTADGESVRITNDADAVIDFLIAGATGHTGYVEFIGAITQNQFWPTDGYPVTLEIGGF